MKTFTLRATLRLPISVDDAWSFFSNPGNLAAITPPALRLQFLEPPPSKIVPGLLIRYRVHPVLGIPIRWVTEITEVEAPHRFADRQREGPYALWRHEHTFRAVPGGVEVIDDVAYALSLGPIGVLAERWLVAPALSRLFDFRRAALHARFGALP